MRFISVMLGAIALFFADGFNLSDSFAAPSLTRHEFQQPKMGVPFRIVFYASDALLASNAAHAVFARIEQLNGLLSDYDLDSELSRLSRTSGQNRPVTVGPDLWFLLQRSQDLAKRSDGAFDITVGPAVNLWRKARREQRLPSPERLTTALRSIGYQKIDLDPPTRTARLLASDMRLDLGGIAKGYAADQALAVLRTHGITRALVAAAGDIVVSDAPPDRSAWRIEIPPLEASNGPPTIAVLLTHAALSTSGDVYQRLEIDGRHYSHIIDPRTGIGLTNSSLVHVIARDGTTADAMATAASVLSPEQAMRLAAEFSMVHLRILSAAGAGIAVTNSPAFSRYMERVAPPR